MQGKTGAGTESQSLPNMHEGSKTSNLDLQRMLSLSLSQIRKNSQAPEYHYKPSPFNIRWIHGYNTKVEVINLNNKGSTILFYAANNCGVLYNWTSHQMRILQGHRHMITCLAVDGSGRWLVTADSGPENVIIVWDSTDYFPQKTIFNPHRETKLSKVALSADAKYLLTLAYKEKACIFWWIWSFGLDEPHAKLEIDIPKDSVISMDFNPYLSEQFLLLTKSDIWIGVSGKVFIVERGLLKETDNYELKIRKVDRTITSEAGKLTCFVFIKDTSQILVATSRGYILIYGYSIEFQEQSQPASFKDLKFVKMFKLENFRINVIKSIDGLVATGNSAGEIHFYDQQMKLVYWVHGFQPDCVKSLSFNVSPRSYKIFDPKCGKPCPCWEKVVMHTDPETGVVKQKLLKRKLPGDASIAGKPVVIRDFIVCYSDGNVELVNFVQHKLFARLNLREFYKIVIPPKDDSINGNYDITVPELSVTCLKYSPSGLHLACGLNSGELIFLDPTTITILTKTPFRDTKYAIQQITYSCDSLTLALADEGKTICVYKYDCTEFVWNFIGKHRAHYKNITALNFLPYKNVGDEYKLISLGADRIMVEYDIANSSEEFLDIYSLDRMDQTAVPLGAIPWPNPENLNEEEERTDLQLMLVANDEFKYKLVNANTTMTMATVLGPRYDHPVRRIQLVWREENNEKLQYLLFCTRNVIGLQKMPLDGNPWKHVGLLGHPIAVTQMCFREDSGTLFTIGARDSTMCQWAANYRSVESTTKLGGIDLDPYYCLVENGRPGWLFQEIRDMFYYIQIVCQGTFSPAMRRVKDYIPIDSLPDLMRALGFFPSEYEVENLLVEAKFKIYQRKMSTEIDFEEFVKLYLNHRPAFDVGYHQVMGAFRAFAAYRKENYVMRRKDFVNMLSNTGEKFTQELSWYLLSILSGQNFDDRAAMSEEDFSFLPQEITFSYLLTQIMGLQDVDDLSDQLSALESGISYSHTGSSTSEERFY
ncbi:cilia- and flagella-associated protein 251-like isoform X2 [Plodia interpunctella]|uniref:cilia- and flagella-associated protein 251-like isoform X2 n=1 Tax=Plodia interpunctella TaxID=58824 RepID=UPI0023683091|nr:cilia- and flagella-associated protein 251-like isoform X2 [Plodia interpunctella]